MTAPACRACDGPLAADQAYCLHCGEPTALAPDVPQDAPPVQPAPAGARRRLGVASDRVLAGATAGGLALLVAGVLFGAAIAGQDVKPASINVRVPAAEPPVVNVTAGAPASTPVAEESFTSDWAGRSGWTVQLQSIPKQGATVASVDAAKTAARDLGAPAVGALDSDEHPPLPADRYVVYSKRYKTKALAAKAASALRKKFPGAKAIRVTVSDGAAKKSDEQLKELGKSSGDEFVKKSKKLPDEVESEGTAPPADDKPAGGGDAAETIG